MFRVDIAETARNSLREGARTFNELSKHCNSVEKVREFLTDRHGKLPGGRTKVYRDDKKGNSKIVGFLHSFWNKDWSHNSKSWYQTDWVTVVHVEETPVNILEGV